MARVQREEVGKAIQTEEARAELTQEQEQKRVKETRKATPSPPVRQSVAMLQTPTLLQGLGKSFSSPQSLFGNAPCPACALARCRLAATS